MSTLADAFLRVRPDTKTLGPELKAQTEGKAADAGKAAGSKFGASMVSAIKKAAAVLAIGTLFAAKAFLLPAIQQASDLNETASKAATIFGSNAAAIQAWAATATKSMGLTRQQAMESAASFGDMFQQLKIAPARARDMSTSLTQLAADFASFHNADITQVLQAQSAAFRGEFDSIQRFVPAINAARVQEEALRLTRKKSAKDLTEADKALATYQILLADTSAAQGDFAKTSGGLANQQRILKANWSDLQATVGQALLPVMTGLVTSINDKVIPALNLLWATHGKQIIAWLQNMAGKVGPGIGKLVDKVTSVDWPGVLERAKNIFAQLGPQIASMGRETSLLNNTIDVGAVVLKFLANNLDLVGKALPFIIGAVVLYKSMQAASNATQVLALPIQAAQVVATFKQSAALRAHTVALRTNAAAQRTNTVAQVADNAATNVGILAKLRAVATSVAQRVVTIATTVATVAWTAVQWLLNIALSANPIGIIILAIAALVGAIILLWTRNEGFRKFVIAAWKVIWAAMKAPIEWVLNTGWPMLKRAFDLWVAGAKLLSGKVIGFFTRIVDYIKSMPGRVADGARFMFDGIVAAAKGAINKVISIWNRLDLSMTVGPLPDWIPGVGGKRFHVPDLFPDIPLLAKGGIVPATRGGRLLVAGEGGEDEAVMPLSKLEAMLRDVLASAGAGMHVENLIVKAFTDRFSLRQVQDELALHGVA